MKTLWLIAASGLLLAACGEDAQPNPDAAPFSCDDLLDDQQFAGLRLVDTQSYGSSEDLCHLSPADKRVADATPGAPVLGKRVVIRHSDGRLEVGEHRFTGAAGDPGDSGPVVEPQ